MRTFGFRSALMRWPRFLLLLGFLLGIVIAADHPSPAISRTEFKYQPVDLQYFADSQTILVSDDRGWDYSGVWISKDEGKSWKTVPELVEQKIVRVHMSPHSNKVAIATGGDKKHWITKDQGATWTSFQTEYHPNLNGPALSFHALDSDKIIMNVRDFDGAEVGERTIYTLDGFKTHEVLREKTVRCMWVKEQELFGTESESKIDDRTLCIAPGKYSNKQEDWRLVMSDTFFKHYEEEPELEEDRAVTGIASMVAVKGYILAARNSVGTDEMALYVTKDSDKWYRAQFGQHKLKEGGYTIMESTNHSLQVDVLDPASKSGASMGILYTSNYAGQYFTQNEQHTNRNQFGFVDFEKVVAIEGVVITNVVDNFDAVLNGVSKKLVSKISFDDGRTFEDMKSGNERLHLHSITDQRNAGRVFSSPAPGILMGVGNTGDYLKDYMEGDLYVSDDAGLTWTSRLPGAHKYEFGDSGSILFAMYDEGEIDEMIYSLDHGKNWEKVYFNDYDLTGKVRPQLLSTVPDSTSLKFVMVGTTGRDRDEKHWIYHIDFEKLDLPVCKSSDYEIWSFKKDPEGDATCVMGATQSFHRRKTDTQCFIAEEFMDPQPERDSSKCPCEEKDFECEFGYMRSEDRKSCEPIGKINIPNGVCENESDEFEAPSGFQKIPGNTCNTGDGIDKTKKIMRPCTGASVSKPASGDITNEITPFPAENFREYYYLERTQSSSGDDETVVLLTDDREVYITHDHGKTWNQDPQLRNTEVVAIYPNRHFNDRVYFITASDKVYYSLDRGKDIHDFQAPGRPNSRQIQILRFHATEPDWLIWTSCEGSQIDCQTIAHATTKNGIEWNPLMKSVENCEYVYRKERPTTDAKLIYCTHFSEENTNGRKELLASDDFFSTKEVKFNDMLNFATMSEYIIVAAKEGNNLKVDASVDGKIFADAKFPQNLQVPHQQAYTVLDSSTHSIFLHVTVNGVRDQEYGSIIKSNSNGTSYVLSVNGVNRNQYGFVDFEKMMSLEGVAIVNVVSNREEADGGSAKKLKTYITHNDGAEWALITPPEEDADGKKYECHGNAIEDCALHLHGYTEREDARDTYASASAVGLLMGIGNVGPTLGRKNEGNTFISTDGGISWNTAKNGQYMWEYGDQGSIIVIVERKNPTTVVFYSRDEGKTWTEYQFSPNAMQINDITTVPSDTSRNFLLWGKETSGSRRAVTVNLDFSGLTDKKCQFKQDPNDNANDYTLWEPQHPKQKDGCLNGHVAQYWRKKTDRDCYNGALLDTLYQIKDNCTCTRQDFECDYNFEPQPDGSCKPVPGLPTKIAEDQCRETPGLREYHEITGYRKVPLSTCQGGEQLDGQTFACPGYEEEYRKKHGISGAGLFFAITIPVLVAIGVGYWVYRRMDGRFGRIRLGGDGPALGGAGGSVGGGNVADSPWVRYPIAAVAGLAAVVMATPRVVGGVVRAARERFGRRGGGGYGRAGLGSGTGRGPFTTRGSFRRGPGYSAVGGGDEGELLGDDSEDEV